MRVFMQLKLVSSPKSILLHLMHANGYFKRVFTIYQCLTGYIMHKPSLYKLLISSSNLHCNLHAVIIESENVTCRTIAIQ